MRRWGHFGYNGTRACGSCRLGDTERRCQDRRDGQSEPLPPPPRAPPMSLAGPSPALEFAPPPIIGASRAMAELRATIRQVGRTDVSVLVTGPSGSGKELVARGLHAASPRASRPFVALNCAAIPRDLLESELFGHERGAFTGAVEARTGRFEEAHCGTLFLDEIGDMPLEMQAKLLRVLEERRVERIGGGRSRAVDVRLIAATHRDLAAAIDDGRFREDLYFRLAVFPIALPPLGDHPEDIAELALHFAGGSGAGGGPRVRFSSGALAAMARAPWRGNVRELRNFVERATVVAAPGGVIDAAAAEALLGPTRRRIAVAVGVGEGCCSDLRPPDFAAGPHDLDCMLAEVEELWIAAAVSHSRGVVAEAARLLGLRRTTLLDRMRKHGISARRDGTPPAAAARAPRPASGEVAAAA